MGRVAGPALAGRSALRGSAGAGSVSEDARHDLVAVRLAGSTSQLVRAGGLTLGEHQAGDPSRGPASARRLNVLHGVTRARKQPCNQGVRVPHLAGSELVTTPSQGRCRTQHAQHPLNPVRVVSNPHWAFDRLGDVREGASGPAPNFVAEEAESAEPPCSNRPLTNDTAVALRDVPDRPHFDRVGDATRVGHETSVIEIQRRPVLSRRRQPLVHASVPAHDLAARTEREPVQVKPRLRATCHTAHQDSQAPPTTNANEVNLGCQTRGTRTWIGDPSRQDAPPSPQSSERGDHPRRQAATDRSLLTGPLNPAGSPERLCATASSTDCPPWGWPLSSPRPREGGLTLVSRWSRRHTHAPLGAG